MSISVLVECHGRSAYDTRIQKQRLHSTEIVHVQMKAQMGVMIGVPTSASAIREGNFCGSLSIGCCEAFSCYKYRDIIALNQHVH